ncbi:hypothetical protein BFP72_17625 [Reichenbachiella sp. 5M10]|uniref:DUF1801 domain-containing protein n=1 Tax=Reichenbachiella sp. 5M10 TaxID=1889772 RepID=UPI000C158249|nr:DUF1801 domain-containing protein [Reichenbachiella sp. 5M10]PIB37095.1 hypothetical protein BFP72_17625 [Reichenbachiella sp. 5M10]
MQSKASTVQQYLDELPDDRRLQISQIRELILSHLPNGYVETMNWGMISYEIPLDIYPDTYNKKPLLYAALASQKRHMAVYLSGVYCDKRLKQKFENDYQASGKKLDMGKSCVRFTKIENLPLDVIGEAIAAVEVEDFIRHCQAQHRK